jgi:predicted TIM-barrel fold metal-dependent hydrolase
VIDSDGHFLEYVPSFLDYLRDLGGSEMAGRFEAAWAGSFISPRWYELSPAERRDTRTIRPAFWNVPTKNTLDLATAMLPKLLFERMEEIGLDFTVLYPGLGLVAPEFEPDEVRRLSCRALNTMYAEMFAEFSYRMTPVAVIPMHTPEEAIEEMEHAVRVLGLRAILMPSYVQRPIERIAREHPEAAVHARWLDTFGIDSLYDYDPVWQKCQELKLVPTFHSGSMGWINRRSISSYVYNHIGHFATASEALCKSLFMGGVTRRFPDLKFSFLEGGVGWARNLLADLVGHWEKRNLKALSNYDPAQLDREQFTELFRRYGAQLLKGREMVPGTELLKSVTGSQEDPAIIDEFSRCQIERAEQIAELFVPNFYFGCEADDPITASAFDTRRNPLGARLNAIYGSDIGHWDVPDMREVTEEAYEPVEKGLITQEDFRDFVFGNPVRVWTGLNPDFFRGTAVEKPVAEFLA